MDVYKITQYVETDSHRHAAVVAAERLNHDENYGFYYQFGDQKVERVVPLYMPESDVLDRLIKKAIAGALIMAVTKTLHAWAKEK